jgi:phospholipid/cholesterol/gamma-HCH transport system substrate-binding protein
VVQGVSSTFFDPILEQVGLGPVERSHLSHTISEVRQTVDAAGPRLRQILGTVQETATGVRESAETIRPALESSAGNIEDLVKRVAAAGPKIEAAIGRLESITTQADGLLTDNRPNIRDTIAGLRDLMATVQDIANKDRVKVEKLLDNLDVTRARADRVLYQADLITSNGAQIMTKGRADMERTVANVRDATDWGNKLVQKIFANPFVLSPFYKPTPEDVRVQAVYDTAQVFTKGAQELHDLVKTLDAMQTKSTTPAQRQEVTQIQQHIQAVTERLGQTSQRLADALKPAPRNARLQR